jgi:hypothetical protein
VVAGSCRRAPVDQWAVEASTGYPPSYQALAIEGSVVDAATDQPLPGVIVVAAWLLSPNPDREAFQLLETVTDEGGRFSFPAWGPKPAPSRGVLQNDDPQIYLFSPGYQFAGCSNPPHARYIVNKSSVRWTECNHRKFQLRRFEGSTLEYGKMVKHLQDNLLFAFRYEDCAWRNIPRTLRFLDHEASRLKSQGARRGLGERPETLQEKDDARRASKLAKCGAMSDFVREQAP